MTITNKKECLFLGLIVVFDFIIFLIFSLVTLYTNVNYNSLFFIHFFFVIFSLIIFLILLFFAKNRHWGYIFQTIIASAVLLIFLIGYLIDDFSISDINFQILALSNSFVISLIIKVQILINLIIEYFLKPISKTFSHLTLTIVSIIGFIIEILTFSLIFSLMLGGNETNSMAIKLFLYVLVLINILSVYSISLTLNEIYLDKKILNIIFNAIMSLSVFAIVMNIYLAMERILFGPISADSIGEALGNGIALMVYVVVILVPAILFAIAQFVLIITASIKSIKEKSNRVKYYE